MGDEESNFKSLPRFTLRALDAVVKPSPREAKGLDVTSVQVTPVIKPASFVSSLVVVGTLISTVTSAEAFAVNVPTEVLLR